MLAEVIGDVDGKGWEERLLRVHFVIILQWVSEVGVQPRDIECGAQKQARHHVNLCTSCSSWLHCLWRSKYPRFGSWTSPRYRSLGCFLPVNLSYFSSTSCSFWISNKSIICTLTSIQLHQAQFSFLHSNTKNLPKIFQPEINISTPPNSFPDAEQFSLSKDSNQCFLGRPYKYSLSLNYISTTHSIPLCLHGFHISLIIT